MQNWEVFFVPSCMGMQPIQEHELVYQVEDDKLVS
jgi:hypothetical protein